jgi:ABC-2 type transport system permease protein
MKKDKINKEEKENKFIQTIKKKWLINGAKTLILVALLILIFIAINMWTQSLNLNPIDLSQDKLYTLTDESQEKVKNIQKDVNIYFVEYEEGDSNFDLAKQYTNANEKIKVEIVNASSRPDLASKYGLETGNQGIIVECGDKYKVLTSSDLVTYDTSTYETISIAEQKLTSAIKSVTSDVIPKVYFLEGYSEFSLSSNMQYLNIYLANEVNEIKTLDLLSSGKVPDDCDTLVITTPSKDFDEIATNAIINYINSGKNILWLNAALTKQTDMPNVAKILAMYGVKPFEKGVIRETDSSKMISGSADLIKPEIEYSTITKDIYNTTGLIFLNATKINLVDETALEELKVSKTELLHASDASYFRTDFTIQTNSIADNEEKGKFLIGAELSKTISSANEETGEKEKMSKLVIYGENYFITDYQMNSSYSTGIIQLAYNKDLVLNSMSYLVNRQEDITARKNTGTVTYTATEQQDIIIRVVIFAVPILIIIAGIIVWIIRRRKK